MRSLVPALLSVSLLAACAVGGTVYNTDFEPAFRHQGAVPLGGIQPVATLGTPPPGLTAEGFVSLMRAPPWYQPTRFALAPPDQDGFRFVVAFGTDTVTPLCDSPRAGGDPGLVAASLCLGTTQVSRAATRLTPGGDIGADVAALMRGLLPPLRDPGENPRCRIIRDC